MSNVNILLNKKPKKTGIEHIQWLSAGDRIMFGRRKVLEVQRNIDNRFDLETMVLHLHNMNSGVTAIYSFDSIVDESNDSGMIATPLSMEFINDKPQRILFHIQCVKTLQEVLKPVS